MDVLFRAAGDPELDGATLSLPVEVDLDAAVDLTTPIVAPVSPHVPHLVEKARADLRAGAGSELGDHPLPDNARLVEDAVLMQLAKYGESHPDAPERLYVLEFQGYRRQYVMFGRTTNLTKRLTAHQLAATPHGFALLQGWVSPGVANAHNLEQSMLMVGSMLHGTQHFRERFYDMSFEKGLSIARAVFELHTDWRTRCAQTNDSGPFASAHLPSERDTRLPRHAQTRRTPQPRSATARKINCPHY